MKWLRYVGLVALVLLSVATGVTKLVQMPEEMAIFRNAGFPDALTLAFGAAQVLGGLLLLARRTRVAGAGLMGVTFVIATGVLFVNGMIPFAVFSVSFIALAAWFALRPDLGAPPGAAHAD